MFAILLFILKNDKVLYFLPNFEKLKEKLIKTNESAEMLLQEENREITLDWSEYTGSGTSFRVFEKRADNTKYESTSTYDYYNVYDDEESRIKVLNIYPLHDWNGTDFVTKVTFNYNDGTSEYMERTALLKVLLEGGTIIDNGYSTYYKPYGELVEGNGSSIKVTPVSTTTFNANPNQIWDYDVVVFGFGDRNGAAEEQLNDAGVEELRKYLEAGYGVLSGEGVIGEGKFGFGLPLLREYFNIDVGKIPESNEEYTAVNIANGDAKPDFETAWAYDSATAQVIKKGLITMFPYELKKEPFSILRSTVVTNATKGNTWINLINGSDGWNRGPTENYYNAGGIGNPYYFLTTYNNTATTTFYREYGNVSEEEQKILANTIYYLKQKTQRKESKVYFTQDINAPKIENIELNYNNENDNIDVICSAQDLGSVYSYYVEAYDENNKKVEKISELKAYYNNNEFSATTNKDVNIEIAASEIDKYYYIVNNDSNILNFDINNAKTTEIDKFTIATEDVGKYIHIKAIDKKGNISEEYIKKIDGNIIFLSASPTKENIQLNWKNENAEEKVYELYRNEQKITNTKISDIAFTDATVKDEEKPKIDLISVSLDKEDESKHIVKYIAKDIGNSYEYFVKSYDKTNTEKFLAESNKVKTNFISGIKGAYYIIDGNSDNYTFDKTEAIYITDNNFRTNKSENTYIHMIVEDNAGNISEPFVKKLELTLNLNAKFNSTAAYGKGGMDLNYTTLDNNNDIFFKVYQEKENSGEWKPISTVDFYKETDKIKILNVYPLRDYGGNEIEKVTCNYNSGETQILPKSALLKLWMQGGEVLDGNVSDAYAYGRNPITNQQLMDITPVSSEDFNENPNQVWNYDIVVFGMWDAGGNENDQLNDIATNVIEEYIQAGYGVLTGISVIGDTHYGSGINKLRSYFGIETGRSNQKEPTESLKKYLDFPNIGWSYKADNVKGIKNGTIVNFPYELSLGINFSITETKLHSNAASGDVWFELDGNDNFDNRGSINNYYNAGGTGNPKYYLTTNNNTAATATGNGPYVNREEQKILANTLFYLKQRTKQKSFTDISAQDTTAPSVPEIQFTANSKGNKIEVQFSSEDLGTNYSYKVCEYAETNPTEIFAESNIIKNIKVEPTGINGYYYIVDSNSENVDFDVNSANYTENNFFYLDFENEGKYIHVKAKDNNRNVGKAQVKQIDTVLFLKAESIDSNSVKLNWSDDDKVNRVFDVYRKDIFGDIELIQEKIKNTEYIDILEIGDINKPEAPTISTRLDNDKYIIKYSGKDIGTDYIYKIKAYNTSNLEETILVSNENTQTLVSGISGAYYIIDDDRSNKDFVISEGNFVNNETFELELRRKR